MIRCFLVLALFTALAGAASGQAAPTPSSVSTQLIGEAKASFARVKDYSGLFYKQERVNGQLLPEQTIQLRVRQQPFSVGMKWVGPQKLVGQEATFVAGQNDNKMRGKSAGPLLGAVGFISMDPRDPKAMAGNRHAINECGLGFLIDQLAQNHELEKKSGEDQHQITFGEYRFLNRPVIRMETAHRVNNGQFYSYRTVVFFDKETRLPIRVEAYDWPRAGGAPNGELLECYSYIDLKFNVGLTDAAFAN